MLKCYGNGTTIFIGNRRCGLFILFKRFCRIATVLTFEAFEILIARIEVTAIDIARRDRLTCWATEGVIIKMRPVMICRFSIWITRISVKEVERHLTTKNRIT